jgi:membrane-associated phospholipid phosphatase
VFHGICYYTVNLINSWRSPASLLSLKTAVDGWIPLVEPTWAIYYFGDVYIVLLGIYVLVRMPADQFRRAVGAYAGMIALGAAIQLLLPAEAPWPTNLTSAQRWMHEAIAMRPYACLPSMHVALTVLPAALSLSVLRPRWVRSTSLLLATVITLSTLSLKEHYFLDAVAGIVLGLAAYAYWRCGQRMLSAP